MLDILAQALLLLHQPLAIIPLSNSLSLSLSNSLISHISHISLISLISLSFSLSRSPSRGHESLKLTRVFQVDESLSS